MASKLNGFLDSALHPQIQEALIVLRSAEEAYTKVLDNIERSYLRALDSAYEDQAAALRKEMVAFSREPWASDGVKPKGFCPK